MNTGRYARLRKAAKVQQRVRASRNPPAVDGWDKVLDASERSPALHLRRVTATNGIGAFGRNLPDRQIESLKRESKRVLDGERAD